MAARRSADFRLEDSGDRVQALSMQVRFWLVLLMAILFAGAAPAQPSGNTPSAPEKKKAGTGTTPDDVSITVDYISVPEAEAVHLVRLDAAALWQKLAEMIKDGTAKSESLQTVSGISGQSLALEAIEEVRYPTQFEPPSGLAEEWGKEPKPGDLEATRMTLRRLLSLTQITAFETRNVGSTIEVKPRLSQDRQRIELYVVATRTRLDRFESFRAWDGPPEIRYDQPIFQTHRIETTITAENGKPYFMGVCDKAPAKQGKDAGRTLLLFVTAKTQF